MCLCFLFLQALENPMESYNKYQSDTMTKYADVVAAVNQAGVEKLQSLQLQHQVQALATNYNNNTFVVCQC